MIRYKWLVLKNNFENIIIYPFILIGRTIALLLKKEKEHDHFYFFPFFHIGGAEKVHYLIAQATATNDSIIYFTRKSKGRHFVNEFEKIGCRIKDISMFTDNRWIFPINLIFRGLISHKINAQDKKPLVFNGQSNFGYKISPWIKKDIIQIDLIHALNTFSVIRISFLRFYIKSVTISNEIIEKHQALYQKYKVPEVIIHNIIAIPFGISLPPKKEKKFKKNQLRVLYVGRGSLEKRIHLIAKMAMEIHKIDKTIIFSFAGDVESFIPKNLHSHCQFLGVIHNEQHLQKIYEENDILIVTSSTESGPLVIMEAMTKGLSIISTVVGIVPDHVKNNENGFLFSNINNEQKIIEEGVYFIRVLQANRKLLEEISLNNINHSYTKFGMDKFNNEYQQLFLELKAKRPG